MADSQDDEMPQSPASEVAQDSDAGNQNLPEPAPVPEEPVVLVHGTKVLAAIAASATNATIACKLTREMQEALADQKKIQKMQQVNSVRLKKARQKKYRLLKRMDGLDEEGIVIMTDLCHEVQAKRVAKRNPNSSSSSPSTSPKAKGKKK